MQTCAQRGIEPVYMNADSLFFREKLKHVAIQFQFLAEIPPEHKSACSYTASVPPEHKSSCSYTASVPPEHKSASQFLYTLYIALCPILPHFAAGHVRLVGDARDVVGAVELFHPQTGWTGICADPDHAPSWLRDNQAAEIVCRQLGYQGGTAYVDRLVQIWCMGVYTRE